MTIPKQDFKQMRSFSNLRTLEGKEVEVRQRLVPKMQSALGHRKIELQMGVASSNKNVSTQRSSKSRANIVNDSEARSIKKSMPPVQPGRYSQKYSAKEKIKMELLRDWKNQEKYFSKVIADQIKSQQKKKTTTKDVRRSVYYNSPNFRGSHRLKKIVNALIWIHRLHKPTIKRFHNIESFHNEMKKVNDEAFNNEDTTKASNQARLSREKMQVTAKQFNTAVQSLRDREIFAHSAMIGNKKHLKIITSTTMSDKNR